MKTIIKSHDDEATDFSNKKIPKVESNHTCLAVISLDAAGAQLGMFWKVAQNLQKFWPKRPLVTKRLKQ